MANLEVKYGTLQLIEDFVQQIVPVETFRVLGAFRWPLK